MMKSMLKKPLFTLILFTILLFVYVPASFAASPYADGEHSLNYTVLKADSDSASMANDYFLKPAKLIVKNGEMKIQMTLKNSSWIKSLELGNVAQTVISEDTANDRRVVEFKVTDISKPVQSKMHIKFKTAELDYDNHYTVRFNFDSSGIPQASAVTSTKEETGNKSVESTNQSNVTNKNSESTATDKSEATTVENPQTSDGSNFIMMVTMLLISAVFLVYKIRKINFLKN